MAQVYDLGHFLCVGIGTTDYTDFADDADEKESRAEGGDAERKLRSLRPGGSARDLFYPLTLGAGVIYLVG